MMRFRRKRGADAQAPSVTPWERLTDGRPWRLSSRKHFTASVRAIEHEIFDHARRQGLAVHTVIEDFRKFTGLWVQFGDVELAPGEPCPCGNRSLVRTHHVVARCTECGRRILLRHPREVPTKRQMQVARSDLIELGSQIEPDGEHVEQDAPPGRPSKGPRLSQFDDVQLAPLAHRGGREQWYGKGHDHKGRQFLLLLEYPTDEDGQRLPDPHRPGEHLYQLLFFPAKPFSSALNLDMVPVPERDED